MPQTPAAPDPVEAAMASLLQRYHIAYTRPDSKGFGPAGSKAQLDFYLLDFGLYIEVKQWPTQRLDYQLESAMPHPVMVLVRESAVAALELLIEACAPFVPKSDRQ